MQLVPPWFGGAFTHKSAEWFASLAQCVKHVYGFDLDYVSVAINDKPR